MGTTTYDYDSNKSTSSSTSSSGDPDGCPEGKKCFQQRITGQTECAEPGSYSWNFLWFPKDSDKPCEQICCKTDKPYGNVLGFDRTSRGKCNSVGDKTGFKTTIVDMANCEDGGNNEDETACPPGKICWKHPTGALDCAAPEAHSFTPWRQAEDESVCKQDRTKPSLLGKLWLLVSGQWDELELPDWAKPKYLLLILGGFLFFILFIVIET